MSPVLISFLLTVGLCTWIYTKLQKYTGSNTKQSAIGTAVAGIVIFGISWSILSLIF